ncbi:MAG: amino acid adenylation domain-containing protein [Acidobacteriota bacterium]
MPVLPPLPIQYADFARWQRGWLEGEAFKRQLEYWKGRLEGAPTLKLPTDRPRPAEQSSAGAKKSFAWPADLARRLKALGRSQDSTLFMTLLAAFQSLLHRYSGQTDISLGTPIANRTRVETEGLIGFFVNTLVLRADLSGRPSFRQLLTQVRETALDAYAHQDVPFEHLVEALQPQRSLSRSPLFQVMFILQNAPAPARSLKDLEVAPLEVETGSSTFDLTLALAESEEGGLQGGAEYCVDLFDGVTIQRLVGHLRSLLEAVASNPNVPISRLPLLAESQRHQALVEWNSPEDNRLNHPLVQEMFEQWAGSAPDTVAVVQQETALSYGELNRRTNQLARQLRTRAVKPETPVGVFVERSPDLIVAMWGIFKAGGAYLPVDPAYPPQRVAFLLEDAGAPVLLTQAALHPSLPESLKETIFLDGDWALAAQQSGESLAAAATCGNQAYVIYTSGSTGRPKGVMIQHDTLSSYTLTAAREYAILPGDRVLQFCSVSFDISIEEIVPCLTHGATLVLRNDEMLDSVASFLDRSADWQISVMSLPTAYWHEVVDRMEADSLELPSPLSLVIIAGERAIPERLAAWRKRVASRPRLVNTYGLTESTVISTLCELNRPSGESDLREVSVGRPVQAVQLYLLDPLLGPMPPGVPGELYVGGQLLARGYRNRPATTAQRFGPNPFSRFAGARLYRTGDLARYRADGNLEFIGRIDHQVKIRGYRIELGEIEAALEECPGVEKALVMTREDQPGHQRLVGYLVLGEALGLSLEASGPEGGEAPGSEGAEAGAVRSSQLAVRSDPESDSAPQPKAYSLKPAANSKLRSFLADMLPDYMVPSAFVPMGALPMTPNGKVDRRALPAPQRDRSDAGDAILVPRDSLELRLTQVWEEVLGMHPIGVTDSFFDLGGHSLLAVHLIARIEAALDRKVPLSILFKAPTVEHLARTLRRQRQPASSPLVAIQPQGSRRPFFCVHPAGGSVFGYLALARRLGSDQPFYGLQAPGLDGLEEADSCTIGKVEELAARYIKEVRTLQPQGPYFLGGHSFGGVVAFEMARQLKEQGQEVGLLALLDSRILHSPKRKATVDRAAIVSSFGLLLGLSPDSLAWGGRELEGQLGHVLEEAAAKGLVPPDMDLVRLRRLFRIFQAHIQAALDYRPKACPVRAALFLADQPIESALGEKGSPSPQAVGGRRDASDAKQAWCGLAIEGVEVHEVSGHHFNMLHEPHVASLAGQLADLLDGGEGGEGGEGKESGIRSQESGRRGREGLRH